jgi:hypothetical protein
METEKTLYLFPQNIFKITVTKLKKLFSPPDANFFLWSHPTFFSRFFYVFHFWTFFLSNFQKSKKLLEKKSGFLYNIKI